jgi:hypothetical protein
VKRGTQHRVGEFANCNFGDVAVGPALVAVPWRSACGIGKARRQAAALQIGNPKQSLEHRARFSVIARQTLGFLLSLALHGGVR